MSEPYGGGVMQTEDGMAAWVQADKCSTCVFRPGNLMHLTPGRVKELVDENVAQRGHLTCHQTLLYAQPTRMRPAICRGYADHPQGGPASRALTVGATLRIIRYQQLPKEPSVLLADLLATTGLTMTTVRGEVSLYSTGWEAREWKVTYRVSDEMGTRTQTETFHLGNVDETPTLLECLTHTLDVVRLVKSTGTYEDWGREQGGDDPHRWPPRDVYDTQVQVTRRMTALLGKGMLNQYLDAAGTNTHEHDEYQPVSLATLLPGGNVGADRSPETMWMVPGCDHRQDPQPEGDEHLCRWRVLAVHPDRVVLAGVVEESERGYRPVTVREDGERLEHPEVSFREVAIAVLTRAYGKL